ncbi:MAG TPA: class I SAM-dependent methyltransferase [Candidatus Paceibacterota bacterium]|nr:class I SAM-dependent methyltransferase [Candidatus Paceibacterota bacterium]
MKRLRNGHRDIWNKEYKTSEHLRLSKEPGEDFLKGVRFIERKTGREFLNPTTTALDLGCGNGRHIIYLSSVYGMHGIGYDVSEEAIDQARQASLQLPIKYEVRSIAGDFEKIKDGSVAVVLDLMTSHFLKAAEREQLREEILRVLKPGGWLIFKSFLADEDLHVKRLLRDHPADEEYAYIHPEFGVYEYVWTEEALREFFEPYFTLHKLEKSHRHIIKGKAGKRRTVSVCLQKES